jgi:hypothetical protein
MAIFKIEKNEQYTLLGILQYIVDMERHQGRVEFYSTCGADSRNPLCDMMLVKLLCNKTGGTQYKQAMLSLTDSESTDENIDVFNLLVWHVARYICQYTQCQVAFAVHSNTDNLHAHFIINSVRLDNGYKIQIGWRDLFQMKKGINDFLEAFRFKLIKYNDFEKEKVCNDNSPG